MKHRVHPSALSPRDDDLPIIDLASEASTGVLAKEHSRIAPSTGRAMGGFSELPPHLEWLRNALAENKAQLLDVRERSEAVHGMHATYLIPLSELKQGIAPPLDRMLPTYIHCAKGKRSFEAAPLLEKMGFRHVVPLVEGYLALVGLGFFVPLSVAEGRESAEMVRRRTVDTRWRRGLKFHFPLYAIRMKDFLELDRAESHNELLERGIVTPLDVHGEHCNENLNFISHQWLSFAAADPLGQHLKTMQDCFRRAIRGENIFASDHEWEAYAKGHKKDNQAFLRANSKASLEALERGALSLADFQESIANSWVWIDYLSIPQTIGLDSKEKVQRALKAQNDAIRSIPSYVLHAFNFWICAPARARHVELDVEQNYNTWASRGWCRLEEVSRMLTKLGDGRPLLVTHEVGAPPAVRVVDTLDRLEVYTQRGTSPLTGDFSCCRSKHIVRSADDMFTNIACDKSVIRNVLMSLHEQTLELLREGFMCDPAHKGGVWDCDLRPSSDRAFSTYLRLSILKPMILSDSVEEIDWEQCNWSKPFAMLTEADASNYFAHYGLQWPQPAASMILPAWEGNLPMLRFFVERHEFDPTATNKPGLSALMCGARGGHTAIVRYLAERVSKDHINHRTQGSGLSAISDAAMRGHADVVRLLLAFNADVNIRRNNGKTPLHVAAEEGHFDCVCALLDAGADSTILDASSSTALQLAEQSKRDSIVSLLSSISSCHDCEPPSPLTAITVIPNGGRGQHGLLQSIRQLAARVPIARWLTPSRPPRISAAT